MAKRFTDSDKWKRPWFRSLKPRWKAFWEYVRDNCDHAGIWVVDFELAVYFVGEKLNPEEAAEIFAKQIHAFHGGTRWFILDFIEFQYGDLRPNNNAHKSVLSSLHKNKLWTVYLKHRGIQDAGGAGQGLGSPSPGAQDKDQDKDKDQDLDQSLGDRGLGEEGEPDTLGETVRRLRKSAAAQLQDRVLLSLDLWERDFPGLNIPHLIQKTLRGFEEMAEPPEDAVAFFLDLCKTEQAHRKALGVDTVERVVEYLNEKTGKHFRPTTETTVKAINGRMAEGYTLADFKVVIDTKTADWLHDPKMEPYLNPETLFRPSHFEKYRNQINSGANHGTDRPHFAGRQSQTERNAAAARDAYGPFLHGAG
jgi:uncharacterized phage protein (TIGR02220 family)